VTVTGLGSGFWFCARTVAGTAPVASSAQRTNRRGMSICTSAWGGGPRGSSVGAGGRCLARGAYIARPARAGPSRHHFAWVPVGVLRLRARTRHAQIGVTPRGRLLSVAEHSRAALDVAHHHEQAGDFQIPS